MWYEIFKFEITYRAKRLDTYLFFAFIFLFSIIAFNFIFEGKSLGLIKENSPYVIAKIMAVVSGIFMAITSMIMGVPILRDFEHQMESLIFINPIKKSDYLLGRFLGSFVVLIFIFSGLLWGMILGDFMPWREANNLQAFNFWHYLKPFLFLVLPNLFYGGSIFFVSGALSRKLIVVYTQGLLFFVLSILSHAIENPMLGALLDPLSYQAIDEAVQSWNHQEQNARSIPIKGLLLFNRIVWIGIGVLVLIKGYYTFNFNVIKEGKKIKPTAVNKQTPPIASTALKTPAITLKDGLNTQLIQLQSHSFFHFKSLLKEASFWAIVICGIGTIFINSINIGTAYGVNSYPTSYLIVEDLQEMSIFFFLIILIFYSGELIWKERTIKINEIYDALPISDFLHLAGKFIGLFLTYVLLLSILLLSGILFQTLMGYFNYNLPVYFIGLFLEILPFLSFFTFIAFFFQVLSNSKFVGHLLIIVFFVLTMAMAIFGSGHGLYSFGGIGLEKYSAMNGYGHFLQPYLWFRLYWLAFCIGLFVVTVTFRVSGPASGFKQRWRLSRQRWTKPLMQLAAAAMLVFALTGAYIFHNTNILNRYFSSQEQEAFRVAYEQNLKEKEYLPQPKIVAVNLMVDLYPQERNYKAEGYYILENKENVPIQEIHVQKRISEEEELEYVKFSRANTLNPAFESFDYSIYILQQALQPGDSIRMNFKQNFITKGFTESHSNTQVLQNGTFFNNDRFPTLGYNKKYELRNESDRKKHGLGPRNNKATINDPRELKNGRTGGDGSKIDFEMVLSTDLDQTAIAPGNLQREWVEKGRKFFHYKMAAPMINFYSIVSARYEKKQEQWVAPNAPLAPPVDLEIYYHKGHEYNLDRMMNSMKKSLDYYSQQFSPYQYQQLRIMEFPRYADFAQSFPNTIPYSESLGFILDIEEKELDIPFFITAHEVAHQWWGMQLVAANVQGRHMILESLSQYAALMVMKETYSEEAVCQFLDQEMDRYLGARKNDAQLEVPLTLVEGQEHIYYSKGAINLYTLQDYISADSVNLALRRFIQDWNSVDGPKQQDRYPTSADLLSYFEAVTPDSMQYLLTDLFTEITLFENKSIEGKYIPLSQSQYKVNLSLNATKFRTDSLGIESAVSMDDWIDIGIYTLGATGENELIYLQKHHISTTDLSLEVIVDKLPNQAGIDPHHKLIDKDIGNNVINLVKK